MAKVDRSNREKDARGKFIPDDEGSISRPLTDLEKKLIADWEKKNKKDKLDAKH
jgi:hypothetical protein